jgi:hypothetical protein
VTLLADNNSPTSRIDIYKSEPKPQAQISGVIFAMWSSNKKREGLLQLILAQCYSIRLVAHRLLVISIHIIIASYDCIYNTALHHCIGL